MGIPTVKKIVKTLFWPLGNDEHVWKCHEGLVVVTQLL